ncbi:hypothetical protein F7725_025624 [Dissostichus mawsoni]|uniref:PWWP domain-containing protein n=1 Tax=Dissostichus mawsoni TaxID=36200 RepID=A0A7J5XBQ2_DISMA|nr:hypothetical protein F7725_025624 [Dissostichus mawsoni]
MELSEHQHISIIGKRRFCFMSCSQTFKYGDPSCYVHNISCFFVSIVFQLHKWKMLDRRPILLLAKRGTNGFAADCICPWPIETEDGKNALITIKRIYESVLNGSFNHTGRNGRRPRIRFLSVPLTTETDTEFTLFLTPVSSDLTPAISSDLTPALSSDLTPALSSDLTLSCSVLRPDSCSVLRPDSCSLLRPDSCSLLRPDSCSVLRPDSCSVLRPDSCSLLRPDSCSLLRPDSCSLLRPDSCSLLRPDSCSLLRPDSSCVLKCPIHQGSATFPYKKLLRERIREAIITGQVKSPWAKKEERVIIFKEDDDQVDRVLSFLSQVVEKTQTERRFTDEVAFVMDVLLPEVRFH